MFIVSTDTQRVMVVPVTPLEDIPTKVTAALFAIEFKWDDDADSFTTPVRAGEDADEVAMSTVMVLVAMGAHVMPVPR